MPQAPPSPERPRVSAIADGGSVPDRRAIAALGAGSLQVEPADRRRRSRLALSTAHGSAVLLRAWMVAEFIRAVREEFFEAIR